MFPIRFYMDITQAREEEVVAVGREIAEGLDRWMDTKKSDFSITEGVMGRYKMQ